MHIGEIIKETLEKQGKTVVWFASALHCHRTNVYKIFSKSSINTQDLMRISRILDTNFFDMYSKSLGSQRKMSS